MQLQAVVDERVELDVGHPGQPTQAPSRLRSIGASAVTSPPGLCFQRSVPSGSFFQVDRQPVRHHDELGVGELGAAG